ncbi:hypothetical protein [Streptomyces oceani]|uniref:hypothetical protein n=1 Tax=Streptomyces oceani TaxID=1075402 RepID=UPI000872D470|nr:hypothetical protein [Streptomyces oceani]
MLLKRMLGSLLALLGAAIAVASPFRSWYAGRHGQDYRIGELFTPDGVSGADAALIGGLFLPMVVAALLTLVAVVLRSTLTAALAGVIVLGVTVLWMVRQGQAAGSLTAGGDNGLGLGLVMALVGGFVLLTGAVLMKGPRRRRARHRMADEERRRQRVRTEPARPVAPGQPAQSARPATPAGPSPAEADARNTRSTPARTDTEPVDERPARDGGEPATGPDGDTADHERAPEPQPQPAPEQPQHEPQPEPLSQRLLERVRHPRRTDQDTRAGRHGPSGQGHGDHRDAA